MKTNKKSNLLEAVKFINKFTTKYDTILLFLGIISNGLQGLATPAFLYYFGNLIDSLNDISSSTLSFVLITIYIGIASMFVSFFGVTLLDIFANNICKRIKYQYFKNLLKQEIAWFDQVDAGSLTSKLEISISDLKAALALKLGQIILSIFMFFGVYVVAFIINWKLTLVVSSTLIIIAVCIILLMHVIEKSTKITNDAYAEAGAIAEETMTGIRTITSLSAQLFFEDWYGIYINKAKQTMRKFSKLSSMSFGLMDGIINIAAGIALLYGGILLSDELRNTSLNGTEAEFSAGSIIVVAFCVITAGFALGQSGANVVAVFKGLNSSLSIQSEIIRKTLIDVDDPKGIKDHEIKGDIEFHNVSFSFPSRNEVQIFRNFNLKLNAGQSVAIVGQSGIGKSTIIQLLQRFYDPDEGYISIDGIPLKDFNLKWLRNKFGVVSQQPRLFSLTIKENIALGYIGEPTLEEITEASKNALADTFINNFPDKYDTFVGEGGGQLSGGQKQRVAIARVLIRKPNFLLFDEATSALDNRSERLVQSTLDKLLQEKSYTTILVAHRLSTIKNSDKIIVLNKSDFGDTRIAQIGNFNELIKDEEGIFFNLMNSQQIIVDSDEFTDEEYEIKKETFEKKHSGSINYNSNLNTEVENVSSLPKYIRKMSSNTSLRRHNSIQESENGMIIDNTSHQIENNINSKKDTKTTFAQKESSITPGYKTYPFYVIFRYMQKDNIYLVIGCIFSFFTGVSYPILGFTMANFLGDAFNPNPDELREKTSFWSYIMMGLGVYAAIMTTFQYYFLEMTSENLVFSLRKRVYSSLLSQEMEFFDKKENSPGVLTSILAGDVQTLKSGAGLLFGNVIKSFSLLAMGLVLAFIANAKLAGVNIAAFFIFAPANYFENKFALEGGIEFGKKNTNNPSAILSESLTQIRNVMSLNLQNSMLEKYSLALHNPRSLINSALAGLAWSYSQGGQYAVLAIVFYYGDVLQQKGEISPKDTLQVLFVLMFASFGIAQSASFFGDQVKAKEARNRVFRIIDKKSIINPYSKEGLITTFNSANIKNLNFCYNERPDIKILNDISFEINSNKTYALVGESGCGKSTLIQLIERFYDCNVDTSTVSMNNTFNLYNTNQVSDSGLFLGDNNIKDLNIQNFRTQLGLVSQEPILFNITIMQNILLGNKLATREQVIEAAKIANAHDFISELPDKYETIVGRLGEKLSGGQKQRICIARSILSNPNILLLDEATSALDNESEKIVQEALDKLTSEKPRTTIIIAHRFSTIKNADKIIVLKAGKNLNGSAIIETGIHQDLLNLKGEYFKLYTSQ